MRKLFEKQLNGNQPLTEEVLQNLKLKTYFNNEKKQVGDVVLIGILMSDIIEKDNEYPELPLEIITLNERHFNLFEYDKRHQGSDLPTFKLK